MITNKFPKLLSVSTIVLIAIVGFWSVGAHAQAISGDLIGSVQDSSGAVVPNATVEVENVATGVKSTAKTNESGLYRFSNLLPGSYNISATAAGMSGATIKNFNVELNRTSSANLKLQVGKVSTTVEVAAENVTPIDTTTATVQTTFTEKQAQDLPTATIGLGVLNLSLLNSGVSSSGGVGAGTGPSVGGQRPRNNNFTVEGVDNNNKSVTGPLVYIPNDAVSNFTVLQNQYSPEFGHSSGGQFNTVISNGTNQFHGRAYEYFQNRNLNAIDYALARQGITKNNRYDQNRFGGSIGGPVIKNKLFFFGNYEYNPLGQSSSASSALFAPTAAGYATLSGMAGLNQTNLGILKTYVPPAASSSATTTVNGVAIPIGIIPVQAPNFTNNTAWVASMDYNISDKDQLRGRYVYNKAAGIDASASLPAFFQTAPTTNNLFALSEYHTFTPSVTNEFRLGFNRYANTTPSGSFTFPGLDSFPNLTFDDLNLQVGPDSNAPQFTIQNFYSLVDNVSWTKGKHTFKFGAEAHKYISPQSFTQRARGDYDYKSIQTYLNDTVPEDLGERSLGDPVYYGDQISFYWFVNDTWKVRQNVTLTLGLRHEYTTIPFGERAQALNSAATVPGLVDFSEPQAPKGNFAPRIGLAWAPGGSGNTSVRAGFGISYDVLYDNIGILSLPPQLSGTVDVDPTSNPCPGSGCNFLKNGGILPVAGGIQTFSTLAAQKQFTANHVVVDQKDPYSVQWNLSVQHVFAKNYTFEARYLGTHGVHLNTQSRINVQPRVTAVNALPTFYSMPSQATLDSLTNSLTAINAVSNIRPDFAAAGFTNPVVQFTPNGGSIYHGLALQLNRKFTDGLQFQGAYTWSKTIDDSTADFFSTQLTPRRPQDFQNLKNDRGLSALSRTHRLTMAIVYDVPWFKGSNWVKKNVLGNWEFAPIYTFESPEYADVQSNVDSNLNGDSAGDRAILNPNCLTAGTGSTCLPMSGSGVISLYNTGGAVVGYLATNPNAQYIVAGKGQIATAGRNTLSMRHINNTDLSIIKRVNLTERMKWEFQAQLLNFFNHPQFTPGLLNQINSFGSTSTGNKNMLTPGLVNVGCKAASASCTGVNSFVNMSNNVAAAVSPTFNRPDLTFVSNARSIQLAMKFIF